MDIPTLAAAVLLARRLEVGAAGRGVTGLCVSSLDGASLRGNVIGPTNTKIGLCLYGASQSFWNWIRAVETAFTGF